MTENISVGVKINNTFLKYRRYFGGGPDPLRYGFGLYYGVDETPCTKQLTTYKNFAQNIIHY